MVPLSVNQVRLHFSWSIHSDEHLKFTRVIQTPLVDYATPQLNVHPINVAVKQQENTDSRTGAEPESASYCEKREAARRLIYLQTSGGISNKLNIPFFVVVSFFNSRISSRNK